MIIGFGYRMRAGKDTAADYLVKKYGFRKISFAQALKDEVGHSDKVLIEYHTFIEGNNYISLYDTKNTVSILESGSLYDKFKTYMMSAVTHETSLNDNETILIKYGSPKKDRDLLQLWGTDYRRSQNTNYWTNVVWSTIVGSPDVNFCISDVRFLNELELIKDLGGVSVKITGREVEDGDIKHLSETALDNAYFDYSLYNGTTIPEFYNRIDNLMSLIFSGGTIGKE